MTEQVRYRIDRKLVKEARKLCEELGMTPTQAVSMFFAQMVKVGGLPFRPSNQKQTETLVDKERRNRVLRDLDDAEAW